MGLAAVVLRSRSPSERRIQESRVSVPSGSPLRVARARRCTASLRSPATLTFSSPTTLALLITVPLSEVHLVFHCLPGRAFEARARRGPSRRSSPISISRSARVGLGRDDVRGVQRHAEIALGPALDQWRQRSITPQRSESGFRRHAVVAVGGAEGVAVAPLRASGRAALDAKGWMSACGCSEIRRLLHLLAELDDGLVDARFADRIFGDQVVDHESCDGHQHDDGEVDPSPHASPPAGALEGKISRSRSAFPARRNPSR